jgi:basic amino acid/polyamine antiporter, APA family
VFVALLGAFTPIDVLSELTSIGTLAAFALVSLAVWRLRYRQPDLPRGYRVPWVPVIPILSALASLFLIVSLPHITLIRFVVWLIVGLIVYFAYSRHHSERQKRADMSVQATWEDSA